MFNTQPVPLESRIKALLANESSGQDNSHAERVYKATCYLHQHEGGDLTLIGAATLEVISKP